MIPVVNKKKRVPDVVQEAEPLNPYDSMVWSNPATGRIKVFHEKRNQWLDASYPKAVDPFGTGYIVGGAYYANSQHNAVTTIDIYKFAVDTQLTTHGTLDQGRWQGAGVSSTRYGYVMFMYAIVRMPYGTDSLNAVGSIIDNYYQNPASNVTGVLNSSKHGYRCGGFITQNGNTYSVTTIAELTFADETAAEQYHLLVDTSRCGGVSSTQKGFICGGCRYTPSRVFTSSIQTVAFAAMDSTWTSDLTITAERQATSGGSASTLRGYTYLTYNTGSGTVSTIDKLDFSSHTSAVTTSNLSKPGRPMGTAMSSTAKGYCCMGYYPEANAGDPGSLQDPWKDIDALYFPNDGSAATLQATSDNGGRYWVCDLDTASAFHKHNFQLI